VQVKEAVMGKLSPTQTPFRSVWFWIERVLSWLVIGLASVNLIGLLVLMVLRARYPFELEWIEGAAANSSQWILSGHFLYERPALEFTPLLYNPLFFYLSALVTALAGPGFVGPRLISILATIGCCWLIFVLVRRETGNTLAAAAAAAFYAATFKATGAWMDVGRSDSLLVFFILLAAFVVRRMTQSSRWGALACALCLALAYFSKQSALPFFVAFGGFYLLERRREWLAFYSAVAFFTIGVTWLVDRLSDGWFSFYTWYVVRQTVLDAERIRAFWMMDLFGHVPLALIGAVGALALLGNPFRISPEGSRSRFYLAFTTGALVVSWWNRAAAGAHTNTLMPVMACLGVLIGLMVGLPKSARLRLVLQPLALILVAVQLIILVYDPRTVLPAARDERAGNDLLASIRSYPGEVWIPAHSYYAAIVGKPTCVHWATVTDTSGIWDTDLDVQHGGQNDPRRQIILDEIKAAVAAQRFDAIILDDIPKELRAYWNDLLSPYYRLDRKLFADDDVFWTVSGAPKRPQLVYIRR
jgi:4-amino-4-deoxy-L-arabinose transferase-like glycosyltransferase